MKKKTGKTEKKGETAWWVGLPGQGHMDTFRGLHTVEISRSGALIIRDNHGFLVAAYNKNQWDTVAELYDGPIGG